MAGIRATQIEDKDDLCHAKVAVSHVHLGSRVDLCHAKVAVSHMHLGSRVAESVIESTGIFFF